jgi:hypothetical protein
LKIQTMRQHDFAMFVKNTGRAQAFKMAALGYNTFKDDDPARAERYKETMDRLISYDSDAEDDDENSMPPLQTGV